MSDRFPWKFHVQTSQKTSDYVLGLIYVVNIKFSSGNLSHRYYLRQKNAIVSLSYSSLEGFCIRSQKMSLSNKLQVQLKREEEIMDTLIILKECY